MPKFPLSHGLRPSFVLCLSLVLFLLVLPGTAAQAAPPSVVFAGVQSVVPTTGLSAPQAVALDLLGNLFIADTGNNRVVKVTPAGVQSVALSGTVAGAALKSPKALTFDSQGNLFLADTGNNRIVKVATGGTASVLGTGLLSPAGVAVDPVGHVFISDTGNNRIVEITAAGQVTIVNSGDPEGGMPLSGPTGLFLLVLPGGSTEELFIADPGNNRAIWGYVSGNATGAPYFSEYGIVGSSTSKPGFAIGMTTNSRNPSNYGYQIVADTGNNRILSQALDYTTEGQVNVQYSIAVGASSPNGMALDSAGNLFFADTGNNRIVKIALSPGVNVGTVNVGSTGKAVPLTFAFDVGATAAAPQILTLGASNLDFVNANTGTCTAKAFTALSNCQLNVVLKPLAAGERRGAVNLFATAGNVKSLAVAYLRGFGAGPQMIYEPGVQSTMATGLLSPRGVAVDGAGNAYVANFGNGQITKVTPAGSKSALATLESPTALTIDGAGNLFAAGQFTSMETGDSIFQITPAGAVSNASVWADGPVALTVDGWGDIFVADMQLARVEETPIWGPSYPAFLGGFDPSGVAVDAAGNLYISDNTDWLVWKLTPAGVWSTVGSGYNRPMGLAVDQAGSVYVADFGNSRVVRVSPTGAQTTVGAGFSLPTAVTLDSLGNIYVADFGNSRLVKIDRSTPPSLAFASTKVGTASSDSPKQVSIANIGTAALNFPPPASGKNASLSTNFTMGSATTCPVLTPGSSIATLASGARCGYQISFTPLSSGTITGALTMTDNNLNVANATQAVKLNGMATATTAKVTLSNLIQKYTGRPLRVGVTTNPGGLKVTVTYNGRTAAPATAGRYTVVATISDPAYKGSATGTLMIASK